MFPITENVLAIALASLLMFVNIRAYRSFSLYVRGTEQTMVGYANGEEVEYRRPSCLNKHEVMRNFLIASGIYLVLILPASTELLLMVDFQKLITIRPDFVKSFVAFLVVLTFTVINWMVLYQWTVLAYRYKKVSAIIRNRRPQQ